MKGSLIFLLIFWGCSDSHDFTFCEPVKKLERFVDEETFTSRIDISCSFDQLPKNFNSFSMAQKISEDVFFVKKVLTSVEKSKKSKESEVYLMHYKKLLDNWNIGIKSYVVEDWSTMIIDIDDGLMSIKKNTNKLKTKHPFLKAMKKVDLGLECKDTNKCLLFISTTVIRPDRGFDKYMWKNHPKFVQNLISKVTLDHLHRHIRQTKNFLNRKE